MWNLPFRRLLSLVSRYSDYTCFLFSLSLGASCYRHHNNVRDFHRKMEYDLRAAPSDALPGADA